MQRQGYAGMFLDKFPKEETDGYRNTRREINGPIEENIVKGSLGVVGGSFAPVTSSNYQVNPVAVNYTSKREQVPILEEIFSSGNINDNKVAYYSVDKDKIGKNRMPYTRTEESSINAKFIGIDYKSITPSYEGNSEKTVQLNTFINGYLIGMDVVVEVPKLPIGVTVGGIFAFIKNFKFNFATDQTEFELDSNLWSSLSYGLRDSKYKETLDEEMGIGSFDPVTDRTYNTGIRVLRSELPLPFRTLGYLALDSVGNGIAIDGSNKVISLEFNFMPLSEVYIVDSTLAPGFIPNDYAPKITVRLIYHTKPGEFINELLEEQTRFVQETQSAYVPMRSRTVLQMPPNTDVEFETSFSDFENKWVKMIIATFQFDSNKKYGPTYPKIPPSKCVFKQGTASYFDYKQNASIELKRLARTEGKFTDFIDNTIAVMNFALSPDVDGYSGSVIGSGISKARFTIPGEYNTSTSTEVVIGKVYAILYARVGIKMLKGNYRYLMYV